MLTNLQSAWGDLQSIFSASAIVWFSPLWDSVLQSVVSLPFLGSQALLMKGRWEGYYTVSSWTLTENSPWGLRWNIYSQYGYCFLFYGSLICMIQGKQSSYVLVCFNIDLWLKLKLGLVIGSSALDYWLAIISIGHIHFFIVTREWEHLPWRVGVKLNK